MKKAFRGDKENYQRAEAAVKEHLGQNIHQNHLYF